MIVNKYLNGGGGGSGERGPQGYQGPEGPQGPQGANGQDGLDGKDGADGKDGLDGQTGPQGAEGAQGPQGVEGQVGPQGPQGPQGENGINQDPTLLKSSSGTPENIGAGDVFATHEDASDAVYGNDWTDTGYQTLDFESVLGYHPQAIRVAYTDYVLFDFGFNNAGWHDGLSFNIENGSFNVGDYDTNKWEVAPTHIKLISKEWMNNTEGKTLYLDIVGQYLYIYTDGTDMIWLNDVAQNMMNNVYVGEVIPAHGDIDKVFQANIKSEPNVQIELEGDARLDGTLDDPEQVVTMNGGSMKISFYDPSSIEGKVCDLESYGSYFELFYAALDDAWTLFDSDGENVLIKIGDGESDSASFGAFSDGVVYLSYSNGVLTASTDNEKGWQNWAMGVTHEVVIANELAKAEDLPTKKQLVPSSEDGDALLGWNTEFNKPEWRGGFRYVPFTDMQRDYTGAVLMSKSGYADEYGWDFIKADMLEPKSSLPLTTKDGNVMAYKNASGYGISQAQSGVTTLGWVQASDECETGYTQIRVPYTAESTTFQGFRFDDGQGGEGEGHNLWWHYDGGSNPHWDGDNVPIDEQVDGEFSGTDPWGVSISSVRSGDYLVVTFGTGVTSTEKIENTERYANYVAPNYTNVVTSESIAKIWRGTQAEYNALSPNYDNNTFYIIL